jgi:hypothetical protein
MIRGKQRKLGASNSDIHIEISVTLGGFDTFYKSGDGHCESRWICVLRDLSLELCWDLRELSKDAVRMGKSLYLASRFLAKNLLTPHPTIFINKVYPALENLQTVHQQ